MADQDILERYVKALRSIAKGLRRAHHIGECTETGRAYAANQVNQIRAALSEHDPLVATLFPEVPASASAGEIGMIAGQLADFVAPGVGRDADDIGEAGGGPHTVNVEIGDGVVFGGPGIENIGEIVRKAIASAMAGLSEIAARAEAAAASASARMASKPHPPGVRVDVCEEEATVTAPGDNGCCPPAGGDCCSG